MEDTHSQQSAQDSSADTSAVSSAVSSTASSESYTNEYSNSAQIIAQTNTQISDQSNAQTNKNSSDFLSLIAGIQNIATQPLRDSQEISSSEANSAEQKGREEKHRHHLWLRRSSNADKSNSDRSNKASSKKNNDSAPHFTPLPSAPQSSDETLSIFDSRDGQIFDSAMRLRLHTLIATCLMNGIADSRIDAFMHLLQWQDSPKVVVIAGTFGATIPEDDGPNRKPAPTLPPDNTDALRRNIWPQLGICNAYDAIVERVQSSALQNIAKSWHNMHIMAKSSANSQFAAPSHIILLAVRENPSEQAINKLCQVFTPSHQLICVSGVAEGVEQISSALTSTLAAIAVAPSVQHLSQIIRTDDVLPERALIGDSMAFDTLYNKVYQSLAPYSHDDPTLLTIDTFLRFGGALDQTAHELNVHPNTVRYRLRKVAQTTGWDATDPRASYVLQTAITIGRIRDSH